MVGPITAAEVEIGLGGVGILLYNPHRILRWLQIFPKIQCGGRSVTRRKDRSGAGLETSICRGVSIMLLLNTTKTLRL